MSEIKAIRERDAEARRWDDDAACPGCPLSDEPHPLRDHYGQDERDRAWLLARVERLRAYARHDAAKMCSKDSYRDWPCRCGLDELLQETSP